MSDLTKYHNIIQWLFYSNFNQMVGTYEELQAYLREYVEQLSISDERRNAV